MNSYIKTLFSILLTFVTACQNEQVSLVEPAVAPQQMEVQVINEPEPTETSEPARSAQTENNEENNEIEIAAFYPSPISTRIGLRTDGGTKLVGLYINFNQPMEQSSVSEAFSITPEVDYAVEWPKADRMEVVFSKTLNATIEYTANLGTSAVNLNGIPLLNDYELSFRSFVDKGEPRFFEQPALHSVSGLIDQVAPLTKTGSRFDPIRIDFTQSIDRASVEEAFEIQPNLGGEIEWRDNTFVYWPAEPFAYNSTVEFGLNGTILSAENQLLLNQPEFWSFDAPGVNPGDLGDYHYALATFSPDYQLDTNQKFEALEANGDRLIEFRFTKARPTEITFNLYPADINHMFTPEPLLPNNSKPVYTWQHMTTITLDSVNNIDQATVPANVPPGLYFLEVDAKYDHNKDLILLLISDYSLVA